MADMRFFISPRVQCQTRLLRLIHTCHTHERKTTTVQRWCNANRTSPAFNLFTLLQQRPSVAAFVNLWLRLSVFFFCVLYFRYRAVYNYKPQNSDELELREGDIVQVMEKCDDGWFVGKELILKSQRM